MEDTGRNKEFFRDIDFQEILRELGEIKRGEPNALTADGPVYDPDCGDDKEYEKSSMHEDDYRRIRDRFYRGERELEELDPTLIERAAKALKKEFNRDSTREPKAERSFEVTFSYAYDNSESRHSGVKTEWVEGQSIEDCQNTIHDRYMARYPNCDVTCIKPLS